jgi:CBS domain-containing protein
VGLDDRIVGMVTLADVRHVPKDEWDSTRVTDVMGGRDGVVSVNSRSTLQQALEALSKGDYEQVPVVDDGRLVGVVSRADIVRQIQLREALDVEGALPRGARGEAAPGEAT